VLSTAKTPSAPKGVGSGEWLGGMGPISKDAADISDWTANSRARKPRSKTEGPNQQINDRLHHEDKADCG